MRGLWLLISEVHHRFKKKKEGGGIKHCSQPPTCNSAQACLSRCFRVNANPVGERLATSEELCGGVSLDTANPDTSVSLSISHSFASYMPSSRVCSFQTRRSENRLTETAKRHWKPQKTNMGILVDTFPPTQLKRDATQSAEDRWDLKSFAGFSYS